MTIHPVARALGLGQALLLASITASSCSRPDASHEPNEPKPTLGATRGDAASCAATDRVVTLVNDCGDTVYAAAVGNAGSNCTSNTDCGVDQFCSSITSFTGTKCTSNADCSGIVNGFCDDGVCAFHQCFFAPLGGSVTPSGTSCTTNADCSGDQYCLSSTNTCADVATDGNGWELAAGESVTLCTPTPWAGRFWPRTGCDDSTLECATGQCVGADGKTVSLHCGLSGSNPATLAEINMQTFSAAGDFYDLSMVDGGNLAVSLVPSSFLDDSTNTNLISSTACSSDADCPTLWRCDAGLELCVNPLECGSAGCTDAAGCAASAITTSLLPPCEWGGSGLAVAQDDCNSGTQVISNGTYYGCIAPQDACASNPPAGLDCSASSVGLYGCSGAASSGSCYTDVSCTSDAQCSALPPGFSCDTTSGKCVDPTCCGCPTAWAPSSLCVAGDNAQWHAIAEPFAATFNAACGSAYSFAFDDTTKLMTCHGRSATDNVDYTVTFCPG